MEREPVKAAWCRHDLLFREPAVTSRAVMRVKETYFVKLWNPRNPDIFGIGECGLFRGLSSDDLPNYTLKLDRACNDISAGKEPGLTGLPSIRFGFETAARDLAAGGRRTVFDTPWSQGCGEIRINGLIWMGAAEEMARRVEAKLEAGFRCIKIKIGGIDFESELKLLRSLRDAFSPDDLELRLDANGAFTPDTAMDRLERLAPLSVHSIEQPIRQGQPDAMREICMQSPIPVALDEELIGIEGISAKSELLDIIRPAWIILKPSLCGGISGSMEWIEAARRLNTGWWLTSALESNVGLNAIAQLAAQLNVTMPQGLGTGARYTNNIPSPIVQEHDYLRLDPTGEWNFDMLRWNIPS